MGIRSLNWSYRKSKQAIYVLGTKPNLGFSARTLMLLTAESSLQPCLCKLKIKFYVHICTLCMPGVCRVQKRVMWLQMIAAMWVTGTECQSSKWSLSHLVSCKFLGITREGNHWKELHSSDSLRLQNLPNWISPVSASLLMELQMSAATSATKILC